MKRGFLLSSKGKALSKSPPTGSTVHTEDVVTGWQRAVLEDRIPPSILQQYRGDLDLYLSSLKTKKSEEIQAAGTALPGSSWGQPPNKLQKLRPFQDSAFIREQTQHNMDLTFGPTSDYPGFTGDEVSFDKNDIFHGAPFVSPICNLTPKAALHELYATTYDRLLTHESFFTWESGDKHDRYYTSAILCPVTCEVFLAGEYESTAAAGVRCKLVKEQSTAIAWYSKKKEAIHAAAARCYDCLIYRECPDSPKRRIFSLEMPYSVDEVDYSLNEILPGKIADSVRDRIKQFKIAASATETAELELAASSPAEMNLTTSRFLLK